MEPSDTPIAGVSVTEPSSTQTATDIQTAELASIISSLITAPVLVIIFIAVFYFIKKACSKDTGHHSVTNEDVVYDYVNENLNACSSDTGHHFVANEDIVYEDVDEILSDGIAMNMKCNDAYQATVDMEENEAYGICPEQGNTEDS